MIQELLCGVVEAERKISSISSPSRSATSSPTSSASEPQQQNLRCPRCDSSNTKFCYYNNYNLTQPRHFCKTCRRYWTKGGALRNVPIGGGCRKTKPITPSIAASAVSGKPGGNNKISKPMTSLTSINDVMGRAAAGLAGGLDYSSPELLPSSPMLWASMPHGSHLLALLRASQIQNVNPSPSPNPSLLNSIRIKEAQMVAEANYKVNGIHNLSLDHLGQYYHHQQQHQQTQQQNLLLNDMPTSSGIQELYQRLRSSSSTSSYGNGYDNLQVIANNVGSGIHGSSSVVNTTMATTTTASIFEPIPLNAGDVGYWNPPAMAWSDLSATTNGAFP